MEPGTAIPHFQISTVDGRTVMYTDIWQRTNLVLVLLPRDDPEAAKYAAALTSCASDLRAHAAEVVITNEAVASLSPPAVVVADRRGEAAVVATRASVSDLPRPDHILEWLEYVQHKCPECEGEAR
jgi:hypothetical protein